MDITLQGSVYIYLRLDLNMNENEYWLSINIIKRNFQMEKENMIVPSKEFDHFFYELVEVRSHDLFNKLKEKYSSNKVPWQKLADNSASPNKSTFQRDDWI